MDSQQYHRGTIERFDERGGYGYIQADDFEISTQLLLVHRKSLRAPTTNLRVGDRVLFRLTSVPRGLLANDVHFEPDATEDIYASTESLSGVIAFLHPRGYGFIQSNKNEKIFFHFSSLPNSKEPPPEGTRVVCSVISTERGLLAREVHLDDEVQLVALASLPEPASVLTSDFLAQAILARANRNYTEAVRLYDRGLADNPTVQLVTSYAAFEKNRNQKPAAMRVYQKGIKLFPQNSKLREDAGLLAASIGEHAQALQLLNEALTLYRGKNESGEKNVLLAIAHIYDQRDTRADLVEAVKYYERALSLSDRGERGLPRNALLAMNIAKLRTQHHRGNLAFEFLRDAGFRVTRAALFEQPTVGADIVVEIRSSEIIESYGISGSMLVRCMFKSDVTRADLEDIDQRIKDLGEAGVVDEQVSLMFVASLPDQLQRTLFKRIEDRKRLAPAIIPVPQSVIETTRGALPALRSILDQWLYRRDLFSLNFPVVGRRFFGRDRILAELRDAISNGIPAGIFGLRKVGKTSLLKETDRRATEGGDVVVYLDMLRVPADVSDTRWLYWRVAGELYSRTTMRSGLGEFKWRLGGVFHDVLDVPSTFPVATAFDSDLMRLLQSIRSSNITPRPKIVLLFDEIERLLPTALGKEGFVGFFDFFSYLRGVSQESQDFVTLITGANAAIAEAAQFNGRDNPVFNFFKEIYLQLLEPAECAFMIKSLGRGMGLRFPDDTCEMVYRLTGGHPFFTRQLCSFVAERLSERPATITPQAVYRIVDQYLEFSGKDYQEIIERFARDYPKELDVCIALARAGGSMAIDGIAHDSEHREVSLRHLVGYQIVRLQEKRAILTMELMKRWLMRGL